MRKERMITRTITTTTIDVLVVNTDSQEVGTKSFVLGVNETKDNKTMLKAAQSKLNIENVDNEPWVAVAIKAIKEDETLYGMTESDFIKYAKILPSR